MGLPHSLRARFDSIYAREVEEIRARHEAEVQELHKRLAARDAEIARLNGAASSARIIDTERISDDGGAEYVPSFPSWT